MAVRAGRLRHRVTIEQNSPTQDSFGELDESWSTLETRWARVVPISPTERFANDQKFAETTHRFELRHISGVTPEMRINWDSRTFDIVGAVDVNERGAETHIWAVERTG